MFTQFNRNNNALRRAAGVAAGATIETAACLPYVERTYTLDQIRKLTQDLILLLEKKRALQLKMTQQAPPFANIARSQMSGEILKSLEAAQQEIDKMGDISPPKSPVQGSPARSTMSEYEKLCIELKEVSSEITDTRESLKELKDLIKFSDELDKRITDDFKVQSSGSPKNDGSSNNNNGGSNTLGSN